MKKRTGVLFLIFVLVLATLQAPTEVFCAGSVSLTVETKEAHPGDTVTLSIKLTSNPGVAMMRLPLEYDTSKLEKVSFSGVALGDGSWSINTYATWISGSEDCFGTGAIVNLKFTVKEGATGFAKVTIGSGYNIGNFNEERLSANITSGGVNISTAPPTNTPIPPTNTPVPPTNTPVPPTNTPVPPTNTPVPPTNTPTPKATVTPTPKVTNTPTPKVTGTPIPTQEVTVAPTETVTVTPDPIRTDTLHSGETAEIAIGEGTAAASMEQTDANEGEVGIENLSNLLEELLTDEERERVDSGETVHIAVKSDWISEDQLDSESRQAVEEALKQLKTDDSLTGVISAFDFGITKQVGEDTATEIVTKDIAKAFSQSTAGIQVDVSKLNAPNDRNTQRFILVQKSDGTTETVLILDSADTVTIEDGVPIAVLYRQDGEQKKQCKNHYVGIPLAVIICIAAFLLRKKKGKLSTIIMVAGTVILLALAFISALANQCAIDIIPLAVALVVDCAFLFTQKK